MSIALQGGRGLFFLLQKVFCHEELHRPCVTRTIHEVLQDFCCLVKDLSTRPTRIAELLPSDLKIIKACDTAGSGMGGVFFVPNTINSKVTPHLWRSPFPHHIQAQ